MAKAFFDQRSDGGGAGRHALAPTIFVDALDQRPVHRDGDAFGIGRGRLFPHALIMLDAQKSVNAPGMLSMSLMPFTEM